MSNENELLEPLATEAGQLAIARAINNLGSLENAVRAERAAATATLKADEARNSAEDASDSATEARNWATKTDGYVDQETITIPPEQEGDEPTTETIDLYSARYYAALAEETYNNMQFDSEPTENSANLLSSGAIYTALDSKADKSTTYTKTEVDTLISTAVSDLINSAPSTLDTLEELANALGDDPNFATTIATQLGNKADKSDTYTKTEVDTALGNVQSTLTFDNVPTANSDNPVKSSGIKTALDGKQDTLTFDSTPTANSNNPVTSGGVYTALQNVNIDIDDEITEDSDNPVTSAAIYEALLNFTPSGGSGGAGNASGVTQEVLYLGTWTSGSITLSKPITDFDFIVVYYTGTNWGNEKEKSSVYLVYPTKSIMENVGHGLNYYGYSSDRCSIIVHSATLFTVDTVAGYYAYKIVGIKFSKNLSEQMYSNVLYENASGWSSGSITLNDSLENYDFIEIAFGESNYNTQRYSAMFSKTTLSEYIGSNKGVVIDGAVSPFFIFTILSATQFNYSNRNSLVVYKIIGHKLAKGGYSGIVSDARMTVKSGFLDLSNGLSGNTRYDYNIVFDFPMPDNNYVVMTEDVGFANNYNNTDVTICDKTNSGFTLTIYLNGNRPATSDTGVSWIAIRPNSYTREGMVEDVLFSNASGVNSGTINLSGNISDYDLILFETKGTSSDCRYTVQTYSSSCLVDLIGKSYPSGGYIYLHGHDNEHADWGVINDSTLTKQNSSSAPMVTKVTGIKFGRYISGVAVDTTITSSGTGVPSTNAVYLALQNIPSGGGGGGSITIDSTPTENSNNAVSSGGVYDAIKYGLPVAFEDLVPSDYKLQTADEWIYSQNGRSYYKKNNGIAAGAIINTNRNTHAILVSDNSNSVVTYSSYNTSDDSDVYTLTFNGKTYYYSMSEYGWDRGSMDVPQSDASVKTLTTFSSNLVAAQYIIENVLTEDKTLNDYHITDAYTKTEVDTLIQNAGGGSSITVDSTITQGGTNPVEGGAIYTALGDKADKSTTYTKTEVDTAISSKGDVTTNTDQNITGTKTFVGSKKVGFKQSAANDKLGFTLYGNTGTERGYLEFNPQNTIDGVAGLMTLGNYATSAAALTQVGFRRYSNISGASGAYNLLMPMVADARTPFSLTTTYQNFYLPLGFKNGSTIVKTDKSGVVDISSLLASLEARVAALEGN